MHTVTPALVDFVAEFEGFRPTLYNDPANHATIGFGHLVHLGPINGSEPPQFQRGLSRSEALALLREDLRAAERAVNTSVRVPLTQHQYDALVSFAFNVGEGALRRSDLLRRLNAGEAGAVPAEMARWNRAEGQPLKGLTRRREREGQLFSKGVYTAGNPPPPPPPPKDTLAPGVYSNQDIITAFALAARTAGLDQWALLTRAGLGVGTLAQAREAAYTGPTLRDLPGLTAAERQRVSRKLREVRPFVLTNQHVITAFRQAAERQGLGNWDLLARAGLKLSDLTQAREGGYRGLPISQLPNLTEGERALIRDHLPGSGFYVEEEDTRGGPDFLAQMAELLTCALAPLPAEYLRAPTGAEPLARRVVRVWNRYGWLLTAIAEQLRLEPGLTVALLASETKVPRVGPEGRMPIRFEVELFWGSWGAQHPEPYARHFEVDDRATHLTGRWRTDANSAWRDAPTEQADERERFDVARGLDETAALSAVRMGMPGILGAAHAALGYATPGAMFEAFREGERHQILGAFDLLAGPGGTSRRLRTLRAGELVTFATLHYGADRAADRATTLRTARAWYDALAPG